MVTATISKEKALLAAVNYLDKAKGYDLLEQLNEDSGYDVVAYDPTARSIVFVQVRIVDEFGSDNLDREAFESVFLDWVTDHPEVKSAGVRADVIQLLPIEDRALVHHHINALSEA